VRKLLIHQIDKLTDGHVGQMTEGQSLAHRDGSSTEAEVENAWIDVGKRTGGQRTPSAAWRTLHGILAEFVVPRRAIPVNTGTTADDPFLILTGTPRETKRGLEFFGIVNGRSKIVRARPENRSQERRLGKIGIVEADL